MRTPPVEFILEESTNRLVSRPAKAFDLGFWNRNLLGVQRGRFVNWFSSLSVASLAVINSLNLNDETGPPAEYLLCARMRPVADLASRVRELGEGILDLAGPRCEGVGF